MESALRIVPSALIVTVSQGVVTFDPTFMFCLICCVPPSLRRIWWVLVSLDQLYHGSNWAMMYGRTSFHGNMPLTACARVMAGLMWAPETPPNIRTGNMTPKP